MRHQMSKVTGLAVILLLVSACGSSGIGDIFGGGSGSGTNTQSNLVRGVIDHVDANNRSIVLRNVSGYSSMLSNSGSGSTLRVYYDNQTAVQYQGQDFRPTDLENGDEVEVRVTESGSQLMANTVTVVRDVSGGMTSSSSSSSYPSSSNLTTVRGTVRYVDTANRTLELESATGLGFSTGGSTILISYPSNMTIDVAGRAQALSGLERGDVVEVQVERSGSSYYANRAWLVRDVRQ
jgi:predicted RNA-binding protein with TRAM domain